MSKEQMRVTLTHEEHGEIETLVACPNADDCVSDYEEMAIAARKNAASRLVHFESFGNDSAYLERLDVVALEFTVRWMELATEKPRLRWAVYGHYSSDEGGTWSDHVMATSEAEADFIARQTMADNERVDRRRPDDVQATMEEIEIFDCFLEPITKDEALAILSEYQSFHDKLSEAIESGRITEASRPDDYVWLRVALERIGNLPGNSLPARTHPDTSEAKRAFLRKHGFTVGERDPRLNTSFTGRFMAVEAHDVTELPTADGRNGPWCVVGDDLDALTDNAFAYLTSTMSA